MGGERQGPKGGGYVGGFFQLFDWNAKSRKKLFSSKSDLPEHSKQGKRGEENFPVTRIHMVDEDEVGMLSYASSVTDEEGHVHRAPGVVGRLMGLDSLPISNTIDPYSSPFFDTQSLNEFQFRRKDFYQENKILNSRKFFNEAESLPRNKMDLKHHRKSYTMPIEKFQKEILPPKSAKSIPITQHKLLSPIKKPGFVPSNDAAHIMEAAARIISPGPQATTARKRLASAGSSSAPLKVKELKEKMAVQKKPLDLNGAKSLKGQSRKRSCNGSVGTSARDENHESSASTKIIGKSVNLAIQAKVNVQKREGGLNSSRNVTVDGTKEDDTTSGLSQSSKNGSSSKRNIVHKKPSSHNAGSKVLRQNNQKQNNQKQNSSSGKENVPPSKSSINNVHGRKVVSGSPRGGSRISNLEKDVSLSGTRNVPRKKRSIYGNQQDLRNLSVDSENEESNSNFYLADESRKKGADAISFTFTTPMARSGDIQLPKQQPEERRYSRSQKDMKPPSQGYNVIGDSLSVLLEQKLRELKNGIEPNSCNSIISEALSPSHYSNTENLPNEIDSQELHTDDMYNQLLSYFSSTDPFRRHAQGGEMDEFSSPKVETRKLYSHQQLNPAPILDSYDLNESGNSSSDSTGNNMSEECNTESSCDQGQETVNLSCIEKMHDLDTGNEWELDYIKDILSNVELMFKDCASGRTRDIINPHLFDQMERKRAPSSSYREAPMARKKVLFDCVRECLDFRCQHYTGGGFSALQKGLKLVRRKEKLAMEVYKEIQEWRRLGDCMVDELVDMDMSVEHGKWVDFEGDGFGIGVDIEAQIFDGLVGEVIDDILAGSRFKGYARLLSRV